MGGRCPRKTSAGRDASHAADLWPRGRGWRRHFGQAIRFKYKRTPILKQRRESSRTRTLPPSTHSTLTGHQTFVRYRAVEPEQWLQRYPDAGSSGPSWPEAPTGHQHTSLIFIQQEAHKFLNPKPSTPNPKPSTRNPSISQMNFGWAVDYAFLNPQSETLKPKP